MPATPTSLKGRVTIDYSIDIATAKVDISTTAEPDYDPRNTIQMLLAATQSIVAKMVREDSMLVGQGRNDGNTKKDTDKNDSDD